MGFFSKKPKEREAALVVDIGSGSVGLAIIVSDILEERPTVVWTHREFSLIKEVDSITWSLREINTTLVNAFLRLGSDGLKVLRELPDPLPITALQVVICAPWTYTVSKTVHYTEEHPFTITETLVDELADAAGKKALTAALKESMIQSNGLVTISNETIGIIANEYVLEYYENLTSRDLTLVQLTAVTNQRILDTVLEVQGKIIPRSELTTHSFMAMFYHVMRASKPDTTECCLVDVTNEATEIGIVRDNLLRHTTHAPYGTFTLTREIAALAKIPKEEAYAFVRGGETFVNNKLGAAKQAEMAVIVQTYEDEIAELFKQTGDTLSVPKVIYLHCDADTEPFFIERIKRAAEQATKMKHNIHPITKSFLQVDAPRSDTAILLSANYFHQNHQHDLL